MSVCEFLYIALDFFPRVAMNAFFVVHFLVDAANHSRGGVTLQNGSFASARGR